MHTNCRSGSVLVYSNNAFSNFTPLPPKTQLWFSCNVVTAITYSFTGENYVFVIVYLWTQRQEADTIKYTFKAKFLNLHIGLIKRQAHRNTYSLKHKYISSVGILIDHKM